MKRARVKMIAIQITRKLLPSDEWREMSKGYKASEGEESMRFGESAKIEKSRYLYDGRGRLPQTVCSNYIYFQKLSPRLRELAPEAREILHT